MGTKIKHVVADAGAFIRNAPLRDIAEKVYTIPEVIAESCDKETRKRLKFLPVELTFKEPSSDALLFVAAFAKLTGDYGSLSSVDLRVLALTYDLEKQFKGTDHIKKEPVKKPQFCHGTTTQALDTPLTHSQLKEGDALPSGLIEDANEDIDEESDNQEDEEIEESEGSVNTEEVVDNTQASETNKSEIEEEDKNEEEFEDEEEEEEEDSDDADGWITPSNITSVKRSMGVETTEAGDICVGCLTTDFAMQNVLIQMGLHVISVDGMLIRQAKSYVLRCFGCMRITKDTSKVFCPHCGNKTLKRLTTSISEDGSVKYFLAKNFTIRTRGTKFSLPKHQGGKHAVNPCLSADQPKPDQRPTKKALKKVNIMSDDIIAGMSPFSVNDVTSRSAQLGIGSRQQQPQWAKRNPNDNRQRGRRKGK